MTVKAHPFPIFPVLAVLYGCNSNDQEPTMRERHWSPSFSKEDQSTMSEDHGYRNLAAGDTRIYLPLSWLRCMRMLPTSVVAKGTANDPRAGYILPPFRNSEPPNLVHRIMRNPEMMAQGIVFRFDICSSGERPDGVAAGSQVYKIAFAYRPADRIPKFTKREQLLGTPSTDGWVKLADNYYDVLEPIAADADVFAVPLATSPLVTNSNKGRYRHDKDLVVTFRWMGQRSLAFDGQWVRETRQEVTGLVTWLLTNPAQRDGRERLIGARNHD